MKPGGKGWLKDYLEYRKEHLKEFFQAQTESRLIPNILFYRILQPTGLMYGHTLGEIEYPNQENWTDKDKMMVLLTESLVSSSLLFYDKPITTTDDISRVVTTTLESIGSFYNNIFPELATSTKTLFGKKKSPLELAEKILEKRIQHASEYEGNFWTYFFHNSLLFLDVYIFGQWIHTNADKIVADFFRYEREELRFSVAKVIAAAAHSSNDVAYEEKKLFEYFLGSTDLSGEKRKTALTIFEEGVNIDEINLPSENSWILKKYFLEMAILTIWADKKVEQPELDFLKQFCHYLGFNDDDLENSLVAVEGFVLEHWEQLDYLQNKQDYNYMSEQFIKRVSRIAERNEGKLLRELRQNEEVMMLLEKGRGNELNAEEKESMRIQLIHILKTIPTFVIISLPQKFLTLPVLLKILPKKLFTENSKS